MKMHHYQRVPQKVSVKSTLSNSRCLTLAVAFITACLSLFSSTTSSAQCAKYEPSSGCLFIMGQDLDAVGGIGNYTEGYIDEVLDTSNRDEMFPAGVTTYTDLTFVQGINNFTDFGTNIPTHAELYLGDSDFDNTFIVIGVDQQSGQLAQVVSGQLDGNIDLLAAWVKKANRPVFIRYGYEFNGQHNQYDANTYVQAYRHFKDRMDANGVTNAAYVWQEASQEENPFELTQYYPGDDYVDWCGISRFWADGPNMINFARSKNKPVMVAEATPKGQRVDQNSALWDTWYKPVIDLIRNNNDVIKAFAYINQDWDTQPIWQNTFGNSDLSDSEFIRTNWLNEFDDTDFWIYASNSLFDDMRNPDGCVNADFEADETRAYTGETVLFENRSNGDNTQSWSFGAGASPSSATGDGPHEVTYSTAGMKTVTLTINAGTGDQDVETKTEYIWVEAPRDACLMADEFNDGSTKFQTATYNPVANGAFSSSESNGVWSVNAPDGHDGFLSYFNYVFNDGTDDLSINFDTDNLTASVTMRIRATEPCAVRIDMEDRNRISTDDDGDWNKFEIGTDWQEITINYTNRFFNLYGCGGGGQPCGDLDIHYIEALRFYMNPGWSNGFPWEGPSGEVYDYVFEGDLEIDWLKVGVGCDGDVSPCISKDKGVIASGESVTFESCSGGDISAYSWDFGAGASPSSAVGAGPHTVSFTGDGAKTVSLTITGANGQKITTTTVNVSSCSALFSDDFASAASEDFVGGDGAFSSEVVDGNLVITSAAGHDQYQRVIYEFNDGSTATPLDLGNSSNQKVYIRVKASTAMALRIGLRDGDGIEAQTTDLQGSTTNYSPASGSFNFPVSTEYQVFEIDFLDELWDEWTQGGAMDDANITDLMIKPNPAWQSFPIFGFTSSFQGDLSIDWITVGGDCGDILANENIVRVGMEIYPNPVANELFIADQNAIGNGYEILDVQGKVWQRGEINEAIELSSEMPSGMYFIKLNTAEGTRMSSFSKQ